MQDWGYLSLPEQACFYCIAQIDTEWNSLTVISWPRHGRLFRCGNRGHAAARALSFATRGSGAAVAACALPGRNLAKGLFGAAQRPQSQSLAAGSSIWRRVWLAVCGARVG